MVCMAEQLKYKRLACFNHPWTTTSPSSPTSATRALPLSRRSIASRTTGRASPSATANWARRSQSSSTCACRSATFPRLLVVVCERFPQFGVQRVGGKHAQTAVTVDDGDEGGVVQEELGQCVFECPCHRNGGIHITHVSHLARWRLEPMHVDWCDAQTLES